MILVFPVLAILVASSCVRSDPTSSKITIKDAGVVPWHKNDIALQFCKFVPTSPEQSHETLENPINFEFFVGLQGHRSKTWAPKHRQWACRRGNAATRSVLDLATPPAVVKKTAIQSSPKRSSQLTFFLTKSQMSPFFM
jgi:hypothetical protein